MSHPWRPQGRYLYRQARTSAPVPAAMGEYTSGSFDPPRSPWALPHYVASEPTGVHGLGLDIVRNVTGQVVADQVGAQIDPCWSDVDVEWVAQTILSVLPSPVNMTPLSVIRAGIKPLMKQLILAATKGSRALEEFIDRRLVDAFGRTASGIVGGILGAASSAGIGEAVKRASGQLGPRLAGRLGALAQCLKDPRILVEPNTLTRVPAPRIPVESIALRPAGFEFTRAGFQQQRAGGGVGKLLPIAAIGGAALLLLRGVK